MSVETQKAAPATSVFTRHAWEEHPDMISEENHETTPPTIPISRDSFSPKNFPATLYGYIVLARSFVTYEEETNVQVKENAKVAHPTKQPMAVRRRQVRWPASSQSAASSTSILN